MKKKLIALLAAATMVFAFVGCGDSEEATEETTAAAEETTVEETVAEETTAVSEVSEAATDDIGIDKATEIALADAGFTADQVEFTKQAPDMDDGVSIYEVEFTQGETKYEYDIDAATGNIRDRDTDSVYDD